MALTQEAGSSGRNPKAINIVDTTTGNTVMYTVPAGRMFTGSVFAQSPVNYPIKINGVEHYGVTGDVPQSTGFELGAGCVIASGSSNGTYCIAGIERDLV